MLLGSVNVGGHRLAMSVLRSVLGTAGCSDVVPSLRSGNAVMSPPPREPRGLAATLGEAIGRRRFPRAGGAADWDQAEPDQLLR
ncbi:MAG: DUF1697 domain-containing protein [Thermoleophilia bacterium]|nr:DUF1697 domain-containing protein [Thermoleophilia bacterium]